MPARTKFSSTVKSEKRIATKYQIILSGKPIAVTQPISLSILVKKIEPRLRN